MFDDDERQVIEGIGNEVLLGVPTVVAAIVGLLALVRWQQVLPSQHTPEEPRSPTSDRLDQNGPTDMTHYGSDSQCPICLGEPHLPVETNCGHLFCAHCLVQYWQLGQWGTRPVRCPVCRQQVSVMLRCFQSGPEPERSQLLRSVNDYNRRFSGEPRPWMDHLRDLPTLLRHVMSEFFSMGGLMYMFRLRIVLCFVAAIMYLVSPLDIIPEAVFGLLGLLDDMFVVLLLAIYVTVIYRRFLAARWQQDAQ